LTTGRLGCRAWMRSRRAMPLRSFMTMSVSTRLKVFISSASRASRPSQACSTVYPWRSRAAAIMVRTGASSSTTRTRAGLRARASPSFRGLLAVPIAFTSAKENANRQPPSLLCPRSLTSQVFPDHPRGAHDHFMRCSRFNSSGGLCPLHCRLRGALALDSVEYYQLCETIQFLKRSKALATRTAEATLFLTLPPAEKVHKINEITSWLPGRREQEQAEGGKSFRESSIQTTSSQSPERGTGLRRTCRINGLGGECPNEAQKAAKQVR